MTKAALDVLCQLSLLLCSRTKVRHIGLHRLDAFIGGVSALRAQCCAVVALRCSWPLERTLLGFAVFFERLLNFLQRSLGLFCLELPCCCVLVGMHFLNNSYLMHFLTTFFRTSLMQTGSSSSMRIFFPPKS